MTLTLEKWESGVFADKFYAREKVREGVSKFVELEFDVCSLGCGEKILEERLSSFLILHVVFIPGMWLHLQHS